MIACSSVFPEPQILHEVQKALAAQLFPLHRNLTCEYREGQLLLRGQLTSYYQKQVAQEAVLKLGAFDRVVNQIEVVTV